ncbi:hypothetical protein LIER_10397 [Lithospermum erythrorhizon]|uniref:Uncharacterized protein n=1 Tax=Lithospermum erythrorhizon TaxID=34254 RepID=A0AAV3PLE2_LITER
MSRGKENTEDRFSKGNYDNLCSTPELKKHYDHLVGSRGQVWSPRLETILESKSRSSPWLCIVVDSGEKWKPIVCLFLG